MDDLASRPPTIHLFQIVYSEASRAAVEPGYAVLDNLANPRPDWYEYWPIRRFLLEQSLDEHAFYGFFSPKFGRKTGLSHAQVQNFVAAAAPRADVVLFSPQPDMGAFFLNVFEQGETFDPGLIDACSKWLASVGRAVPLRELVMDTRQVVFSNYFVARPAFWREWLQLNESLFAACEDPGSPLRGLLCHATSYPGAAQRKVFVQERTASLLLATQRHWRSVAHNPFGFGWSMSRFREHPGDVYISDALKIAWREQAFPEYLGGFAQVRERFRNPPATPAPATQASAPRQAPAAAIPALRTPLKRACALMAVYNEADIVRESVLKLIEQGVEVYLIDNASTDGTADQVADLVGRGLIDIQTARFTENGREVYDWTALLRMKEEASRRLGYDWYLHVDADEIRYAPWPGVSLREGIDRVDAAGYNLINFKLFNFRLTADTVIGGDFESSMTIYSGIERFNQRQVKAWKACDAVDLATLGGHLVQVPGARIYPTRFIHKHYPVRSLEHGRRKILAERKARFSQAERQRGWHVQYDDLQQVDAKDVFWDPAQLQRYDHEQECQILLAESSAVLAQLLNDTDAGLPRLSGTNFVTQWTECLGQAGVAAAHAQQLVTVADQLARAVALQDLPPVAANPDDAVWIRRIAASLACMRYLEGDPLLQGRLPMLALRTQ